MLWDGSKASVWPDSDTISVASICETVLWRIIIIHVLFSVRGIRFLDKKNNYYFIRNIVN